MQTKFSLLSLGTLLITPLLLANSTPKEALKTNGQLLYNVKQKSVTTFSNMFSQGNFYGRLRSNTFSYTWDAPQNDVRENYLISGLGGSLLYKSAKYKSFDVGGALYYSYGFFDETQFPIATITKGKDVLSRYDYLRTGNQAMGVLGQAYLRYSGLKNHTFTLGRQLVETFYTKSNDTKMIPNTFDGLVFTNTAIDNTKIKLAYLTKQKLRDHTQTHSVLMYDDRDLAAYSNYNGNDDSAMHKGLTYTALKAAGVATDAPLITGDLHNKSIKNLQADFSFYYVPELVSEVMTELNYTIPFNNFTLTSGMRYIKQFDDKAGKIGGAAYNAKATSLLGYKKPNSLDAQMVAARLIFKMQNYKLNLAYTQIMDEADLITPWRGFPTAGYTRSMARYNWQANTKSYRIELVRNANKTGVYKNTFIQASILHTDADEKKGYYDEDYYYIGFVQNTNFLPTLQWRLRLGYQDTQKIDGDGLDSRLEFNYLF
ncbi:OprD family outer membrane porin [Sulfurimonas sp.]